MKRLLLAGIASLTATGAVHAEGLYRIGNESQESIPLKWTIGANLTYDDNVNPTLPVVGSRDAVSVNPFVGLSFVSTKPQTTWDVLARLGIVYYIDKPSGGGTDDTYTQSRIEANITHRFNERLRLSSRNFVAYDLEPNYAYGYASSRQSGEHLYWQTDNALGYRWTERLATYSGILFSGLLNDSSVPNADRFVTTAYNQFRYQISPQTVLTGEYRYSETSGNGLASDATDHYILAGIEHRFSPTTIIVARGGTQIHHVDSLGSSDSTSPYFELNFNSQINTAFQVRGFLRYGLENYGTIRAVGAGGSLYEFDSNQALRIGLNGEYALSQKFSIFGGVDYIPSQFDDGRRKSGAGPLTASGLSEELINAYIGLSIKVTESITGDFSYNYTDSSSEFGGNTYNRNRINVGIRAEF